MFLTKGDTILTSSKNSFHWPWMITNPQAFDYDPDDTNQAVYGPAAVKAEASSKNAYGTSVIADTYSVTGLAMGK